MADLDPITPPGPALDAPSADAGERETGKKKKNKKSKSEFGSGRAVETLFKILYRMHTELTAIADTKANIMVGINGLLTSVALTAALPRFARGDLASLLPTLILIVGCAISLVCAILSARPRVSNNAITLDDVRAERANLLFFGHFVTLSPQDFVDGLHDLMDRPTHLFDQMGRDIHSLGSVLTRKYRLLRASYTALLVTVVASVSAALFAGLFG